MSNECPKCGQQAMSPMHKLMARPHVCQHCGAEVRMNLVYTGILSLVYFAIAVRILLGTGFSGAGLFYVLLATLVFVGACLYIPFEEKPVSGA